jgi:translation initiation factor 1
MKKRVDVSGAGASLQHNPFAALARVGANTTADSTTTTLQEKKTQPGAAPIAANGKVVVRMERKGHGGKTVTVVSGIASGGRDALTTKLKKGLGCGARLDGEDIVVQGDLVDRVMDVLTEVGLRPIRGSG